jgi:hypothetical protein
MWVGYRTRDAELVEFLALARPSAFPPLRRFGPHGDGGYLMPDDITGVGACISPGVSTESRFDLEIANLGIDVHMADASVDGPSLQHERFHFQKLFLGTHRDHETTTIDDLCKPIAGTSDLLLQMDIEGAEYGVIDSMSDELLQRFRIMVIEFHRVHQIFDSLCIDRLMSCFRKLRLHHDVVHIHPNNYYPAVSLGSFSVPPLLEITFYRRDRPAPLKPPPGLTYPHPLDADCVSKNPSIVLPTCWRPLTA